MFGISLFALYAAKLATKLPVKIGVVIALTILSPWIPKNQNTTVNNTINNIDGNDAVAEISGEKTVNTRLVRPDPNVAIHTWSKKIKNKISTTIGNKTSNGPATIGGTPAGILILIFFAIMKWLISITTSATIIAANIEPEPRPLKLI